MELKPLLDAVWITLTPAYEPGEDVKLEPLLSGRINYTNRERKGEREEEENGNCLLVLLWTVDE